MTNTSQLVGRSAIVTGGSRGIGLATAIALRSAGAGVLICGRFRDALHTAAARIATAPALASAGPVVTAVADVRDPEQARRLVASAVEQLGGVDILVNNAGITRDKPLHKMDPEHWDAVIATNLSSAFNTSRNVIDGMRERGFGRIINIGSINGQKGQFGQVNYSAAKAGLIGFTKAFALETASKGITVNAVTPGYIATEMVMAVPEEVLNTKILPLIPVGRLGEPKEVGRCVVFLASDEAGFITGSTLSANGGQYMT